MSHNSKGSPTGVKPIHGKNPKTARRKSFKPVTRSSFRSAMRILGQVDVERVDFLEPRVPQEEWASIRGHPVVGPEAAGM
jgi:hypothetical protein